MVTQPVPVPVASCEGTVLPTAAHLRKDAPCHVGATPNSSPKSCRTSTIAAASSGLIADVRSDSVSELASLSASKSTSTPNLPGTTAVECGNGDGSHHESSEQDTGPGDGRPASLEATSKLNRGPILQKHWRPFSLCLPFFLFLPWLQVSILASVEALYQFSNNHMGLVSITSNDPMAKTFTWAYLPVALALVISLCWATVDLDVVRTDALRRLSSTEGAPAEVLFYTFSSKPFTSPYRSCRGLWHSRKMGSKFFAMLTFCSALGHVISFLVLPPLQASFMSIQNMTTPLDTESIQMSSFTSTNPIVNDRIGEMPEKSWYKYQGLPLAKSAWIFDMTAILPMRLLIGDLKGASWSGLSTGFVASFTCEQHIPSRLIYMDDAKAVQLLTASEKSTKARIKFSRLQHPI
jgi:Protein of unknown function (DUF3433)